MNDSKEVFDPILTSSPLKLHDDSPLNVAIIYHSTLSFFTRVDILSAVNKLSRFMHQTSLNYWSKIK